jgi:hypothetical protein
MSSKDKLKKILSAVAPALGTAIGGPFGGLAGKFLADKLGDGTADTPAEQLALVEKAMKDPAAMIQLKAIDTDFEKHMASIGLDIYRTEVDDRKSARDMGKVNMWPQIILGTIYNIGYFALLYGFLSAGTEDFNEWQKGVIGTLIGILTAAIPQINSFWFGSSHGSQKKDAALPQK